MTEQVSPDRIRLDAETRRDQILRCAIQVFSRSSYRVASVADIAREAGISEPTVYKHFASKKELFLTILEQVGSRMLDGWQDAEARESDPLALLRTIGMAHYAATHAHPETLRIQFQALSEVEDADVKEALRKSFQGYLDFLVGIIRRAVARGQLAPDTDALATAWQFLSIGFTFNLSSLLGFQEVVTQEMVEVMGNQLMRALVPAAIPARMSGNGGKGRKK